MLQFARLGVDLFFVLSGFLITGILADSKGSLHYFRNFYARRALRIWPLYYLVLFAAFVVTPLFAPSMRPTAARIWPAFVFYVQNIVLMRSPTYHFALGATWSLAVEEQFYLTWPLLVFLLRKRTLAIVSVSLIVLSLFLRLIGYSQGAPFGFLYFFTLSRLDAIAFGSLAALWLRSASCTFERWRTRAYQFLGLGAAGTILARFLMPRNSLVIGFTFLAIAFTGLLGISVAEARSSLLGRTLSADWLRYIGKISYGIYLLHFPIFVVWARFLDSQSSYQSNQVTRNLLGFAGQMLLTVIAASLSWRFFEQPILRLKERFPSGSQMHQPQETSRKVESTVAGGYGVGW
jgi:peptidoglycan/LPS O-acetylase OafA/YrhL